MKILRSCNHAMHTISTKIFGAIVSRMRKNYKVQKGEDLRRETSYD